MRFFFFFLFVRCSPVCCAVLPVSVDTSNEVMYAKKQTENKFSNFSMTQKRVPVIGDEANVEGEENEKFLVLKISVNCLGNKQRVHEENLILTATVHSTCSPTQLFTQGQWWSIFLIHLNRSPCSKTFENFQSMCCGHLWQTEQ